MTQTPTGAVIYARISDARNGDAKGVQAQEDDARRLAARLGWQVGDVIMENDTSAFKRRTVTLPDGSRAMRVVRPGWRRLLAELSSGRADGLLAYDLDRACRDPRDLEDLIDVVESRNPRIPVESVTGSLRLAHDADITMARVMVAVGNKSSRDTGRRVSRARERQAQAGAFSGGRRPFGYEADGVTVRPQEAAEIVRCVEAINCGVSLRQVTLGLRERGVPTVTGTKWTTNALRAMLMSPRIAGIATYKGEEVGQAGWPAIVDEVAFRAAVRRLTDPARRTTPGNTPRWLGSMIYRCGFSGCDSLMIVTSRSRSKVPIYRCRDSAHVNRTQAPVDALVEGVVTGLLSRPDAADLLHADPGAEVDVAGLHAQAAKLRQRRDDLAVDYATGVISRSALHAGTQRIDAELAGLDEQLTRASEASPLAGIAGRADAAEVWKGLDLGTKREILRTLVNVTILTQKPGRQPDGSYFNPRSVEITPR